MPKAAGINQKLKLLYMAKIFEEETDEEHMLTIYDICDRLSKYEINSSRKVAAEDIALLIQFGMDIITDRSKRSARYYLGQRRFEIPELKLLADVGLVGFPNVGKSTLISVVSAAKPKIANYHFTTLTPVLGVIKLQEGKSFVMADIPGLIEGASEGVGLGHEFLRHVDRCRLIIHVIDVSGSEGRDPKEDFDIINRELKNFSEELAERPQIVAANKCDMATPEQIDDLRKYVESKGLEMYEISAATTQGTKELIAATARELEKLPPIKEYEAEAPTQAELDEQAGMGERFEITRGDDAVFYVEAPWLEHIMRTVDMEDYASLQYFQRVLRNTGIIDKLEEMGIEEGDTVNIFGFEFNFVF